VLVGGSLGGGCASKSDEGRWLLPALMAAEYDHEQVVTALLRADADLHIVADNASTPLLMSAQ